MNSQSTTSLVKSDLSRSALLGAPEPGGSVRCRVCPHFCVIPADGVGVCGVRGNRDGSLVNLAYGRVAAIGVEPVEKKPIFHFYPGHRTLSLGAVGCNLRCDFCQNWEISQVVRGGPIVGEALSPEAAVGAAIDADCVSLCFTYTEAVVNLEYLLDVAHLARAAGLRVILLTGGYISREALELLAPWVDAVKFDLKGADDEFYRRTVGGRLRPILEALREWCASAWVEVSTVVLPGINDSADSMNCIADAIMEAAGPATPWHLMRFFPSYQMSRSMPGAIADLRHIRNRALARGMHHVYLSNVPGVAEAHTNCPGCGEVLIWRRAGHFSEGRIVGDGCPGCGHAVAGHGMGDRDRVSNTTDGSGS